MSNRLAAPATCHSATSQTNTAYGAASTLAEPSASSVIPLVPTSQPTSETPAKSAPSVMSSVRAELLPFVATTSVCSGRGQ